MQDLLSVTRQVRGTTNVSSVHLLFINPTNVHRAPAIVSDALRPLGGKKNIPAHVTFINQWGQYTLTGAMAEEFLGSVRTQRRGTFHLMWGPGTLPGRANVEAQSYGRRASLGRGWKKQPRAGPEGSMVCSGNRTQLATALVERDGAGFVGGHQVITRLRALPRTLDLILKAVGAPRCMAGRRFA